MLDDSPSATPRITPRLTTARVAPCAAPCSMFEKGNNIVDTFTDEGLKILETQDNMSSNRLLELSVHPPKKARLLELIEHEFEHAQYKFRKDGKRVFHVAGVEIVVLLERHTVHLHSYVIKIGSEEPQVIQHHDFELVVTVISQLIGEEVNLKSLSELDLPMAHRYYGTLYGDDWLSDAMKLAAEE